MPYQTILIAAADERQREFLARELAADGYLVHSADSTTAAIAKLSTHTVGVLLLADLQQPTDSLALLRAIRAGEHMRINRAQPAITVGAADELSALRAYEAGSDHHLAADTGYVLLRTVIASVNRRTIEVLRSRHVHAGDLHIDTAARTVTVGDRRVELSKLEFDLLHQLASEPTRVFAKSELMQAVWGYADTGRSRTLDSHCCRVRAKLAREGASGYLENSWGHGYKLLPTSQ